MPTMIETLQEFYSRHGKNVRDGDRQVFADGAWCDRDGRTRCEPPTDPLRLAKAKRRYVAAKLKAEIAAFEQFKAECHQQAEYAKNYPTNCPGPPANATEQLRLGKERIIGLSHELAALNKKIDGANDTVAKRRRRELQREHLRQIEEQQRSIQSINLD